MQRYLSFGYLTTIVGGLLLALGAAVSAATWIQPFSAQVVTGGFVAGAALRLAGVVCMVIGLTACYVRQAQRAGILGLVAYVLVVVNLVLQAGIMFSDLFVTGALARFAPGVLDGTQDDPRLGVGFLLAWVLNVSFILFGVASLRARVFGRPVGWALVVMGLFPLVPLPIDVPVGEIGIGLACVVVGVFARRAPALLAEEVTPAPVLART